MTTQTLPPPATAFHAGDVVRLHCEGNTRLDGQLGTVREPTAWGAHVATAAAATGTYRASVAELELVAAAGRPTAPMPAGDAAREQGYTGEACQVCQGMRMVRTGKCETCSDCGTAGGCG